MMVKQGVSALAWRVPVGAMALLVVLAVTIPAGRAWYVGWAIESKAASVRAVESVIFLQRQGVGDWVAAEARDSLDEGDVARLGLAEGPGVRDGEVRVAEDFASHPLGHLPHGDVHGGSVPSFGRRVIVQARSLRKLANPRHRDKPN